MQTAYSAVRENFKRIQDYGWFLPSHHSTIPLIFRLEGKNSTRLFYRQAAVLFLLSLYKGELHVLVTKRSQAVRRHKGENCLPGGMQEPGETTPIETALREAWEETGLEAKFVDVIAVVPPFGGAFDTINYTVVSPVVATLNTNPESLTLTPDGKEVDCIYWMPAKTFLESTHAQTYRVPFETNNVPETFSGMGFNFDCSETGQQHYVWGLTSRICMSLSAIALNRVPDFPYSENRCISNIQTVENGLIVCQHFIALTTDHLEEWKRYAGSVKCSFSIDRWDFCHKLAPKL